MKLEFLEAKEDRLYDDYTKGLLDELAYKRQVQRLREQRDSYQVALSSAEKADEQSFTETADNLLELTKHSKSLWKVMSGSERTELIKEVTSNRVLEGANLRYCLKKPFEILKKIKTSEDYEEWCRRSQGTRTPTASKSGPEYSVGTP